jgi:hypothetical protein
MLLNQLVRINEAGIVADAVNFALMDEPETNQKLCEGFVFNYDKDKLEESTVGVLEALRSSYDSRSIANVHLLVQQYGKGKSHFAVAIANYFSQPANSPEVAGILHQIENATGRNSAICQRLQAYKNYGRHLVICLSGDRSGDIKKQFLQSLLKTLDAEGIKDSVAQHLCSEPLIYLQRLYNNPQERERAEDHLASIGSPDGDLDAITKQLRKSNTAVIDTLKNLAKHLTGFIPDWNINIDIEEILTDLITSHCSGESARFQGILILFDELNFYLQNWAKDPIGAGGTALQNITNICEAYKSKIALLSFTQIDPAMGAGIPVGALEDHRRLVSRLAPKGSTYQKVASSLELVLDNLLIQNQETPAWESFWTTWNNTLLAETNNAYEKRITIYQSKGWTRDKFHQVLTVGCFPLHPLTAYLLCNLDFTIDRTALQFIKKEAKEFIQNQSLVTADQKLNFIYPIALVDTFLDNFANDSNYSKYKEAYTAVSGSDDPNELLVLKALFLFHASGKLAKSDRESHEEVLATLTGLSALVVKAALDKLMNTRDIIYYKREAKLYRFWTGVAPTGIEKEIEDEIREKRGELSVDRVVTFCQSNIEQFLGSKALEAKYFVETNKLVSDDWKFRLKVYTVDGFIRALTNIQTLKLMEDHRGILAYVVAETQADLQDFRRQVDSLLAKSPIHDRVAVAIPSDETGELATILLKIQTLRNREVAERRSFGQAYDDLLKRWQDQVNAQAGKLLKSCTYHCVGIEKIPLAEREKPQRVISVLLENLYPLVPPIDSIDKLRSGHMTGRKVVGFVSRQLLAENLTAPLPDKTYNFVDTLFVSCWKLLKKTSQKYTAHEPANKRVKAAWDLISKMTDLGEQPEKVIDLQKLWKVLSEAPYGYDEYTFTMLLAGWLSYHRKEVALKGDAIIPAAGTRGTVRVTVEIKSLRDWAGTNILEKPDEFVKKWIVTGNAKLIRRKKVLPPVPPQSSVSYNEAEQYLLEVHTYLEVGEPDPTEVGAVTKIRDQVNAGVTKIKAWFQPVETAEGLTDDSLNSLLEIYPKLLVSPPALVLRDDVISVQPTIQQRDRQAQALQTVSEKIEQRVDDQSERSENLDSEEACSAYKGEIQRLLTQISQVVTLPLHLAEALQNSLKVADRRLIELKEAASARDCLLQIENRYKSLGNSPTQQDYRVTRKAIEEIAFSTPSVKQNETYEQILLDLNRDYDVLAQQVEIWEEQSKGLVASREISKLKDEVNRRSYRFTEESSIQRIEQLIKYLDQEHSRGRNQDEAIEAIKATLSTANRKLERIRDVAATKLSEAFQSYQELSGAVLPREDSAIAIEEYEQELEEFKVKGRSALISEGFAKICNLELKRLEDYAHVRNLLQQRLDFINSHQDFADVKVALEQALQNLETRRAELQQEQQEQQRKAQDERIIRFIRDEYKLPKTNTIQFLEDGIKEIRNCESRLYEVEHVAPEIEQIIHTLQHKVANHNESLDELRDRLFQTNTLRELEQIQIEHTRLDYIFKDSSQYVVYQSLQQQFQALRADLERLQTLEIRSQQSATIASCHEALTAVYGERSALHHPERFQQKLTELTNTLQHKIQTYTQELDDFEHRSKHLNTAKEAQKLHEELLKQSACYAQSESSDRHETISTNIRYLIALLQISEVEIKTLEAFQSQLEKLIQWKENIDVLDPSLQERFDVIRTATEQTEARLLQRQQGDAEKWLKNLQNQAAELKNLTDAAEKCKRANRLLNKLQLEQSQHAEKLNTVDQASLQEIEQQCEAEVASDRENQIKILFQQLPRAQRISLYHQLEAYLADPTEELNG